MTARIATKQFHFGATTFTVTAMRRAFLEHVGLVRPYQFERTLVALTAVAAFLLVALTGLYLVTRNHLELNSPRGIYIFYMMALAVLAFALTRLPRCATILLSLAAVEFGFGVGSLALYKYHLISSTALAPRDTGRPLIRVEWHPLLQVVPAPTPANVSGAAIHINSEKRRGKERSAEQLRGKIVVALFGGSTTFDGKPDGQSWAERLQDVLGPKYEVINHGMGGYTTAEHVIQTAFYERTKGVSPTCSVYYVGWNDLRNAHIANLDPAYADLHLPFQVDSFRARRTDFGDSFSPLSIFAGRFLGLAFDTMRPAAVQGKTSSEPDPAFEAIFLRNVGAISAINRQRGIKTIWVGQLMNRQALTADAASSWVPFVKEKDMFALIQRLNGLVQRDAAALGDVYVGLPVERFDSGGFVDQGHFSPAGSRLFAALIAPSILENCR